MTTTLSLVRATDPPSMAVEVGLEIVWIAPPPEDTVQVSSWGHSAPLRVYEAQVDPRIDLVCMSVEFGLVVGRAVAGVPRVDPLPPACPHGWLPVAHVLVRPGVHQINPDDIREVRP